jgi:hypothetical protein
MVAADSPAPLSFKGVMVSSTFTDLKDHRAALIDALRKQGLFAIGMEDSIPSPDNEVISSSLNMVGDGHAYIGLISLKYGQTPKCPIRNPHELSVTELEFNKATELNRPILIFIMDEDHPTKKKDIELDPVKIKKLDAFRESAKKSAPGSEVHRTYVTFANLEDFAKKAIHVVANLRRYLDKKGTADSADNDQSRSDKIIASASLT